ncbi:MAG: hypothetical protein CME70_19480 [Halobacteriovorax sp.]|nr:hypothetical protein [Halobacteriovorax sp.]MBK26189.1 hypothetical protein [Halobacteriovorax sp.]
MIKIGDKVAPFRSMTKTGVVIDLKQEPVNTWFAGGTTDRRFLATIKLDETGLSEVYRAEDLMRLE